MYKIKKVLCGLHEIYIVLKFLMLARPALPLMRVNLVWFSNLGNFASLTFSYNLIILTQSFTYSLNSIWFGLSNKPMPSPHIATVTFSESNMVIFSLTFPITQFCLYLNREKKIYCYVLLYGRLSKAVCGSVFIFHLELWAQILCQTKSPETFFGS